MFRTGGRFSRTKGKGAAISNSGRLNRISLRSHRRMSMQFGDGQCLDLLSQAESAASIVLRNLFGNCRNESLTAASIALMRSAAKRAGTITPFQKVSYGNDAPMRRQIKLNYGGPGYYG